MYMGGLVVRKAETVTVEWGGRYFNSAEQMCRDAAVGSDPTVLFCDDFEDGVWAKTNADTSGGKSNPDNDGWNGNIFITWPDQNGATGVNDGFARCGTMGAAGTDCAATNGGTGPVTAYQVCGGGSTPVEGVGCVPQAATQGMFGKHWFAPDEDGYTDLYFRWYQKEEAGFINGLEKIFIFTNTAGNYQANIMAKQVNGVLSMDSAQDVGLFGHNITAQQALVPGTWWYMEVHIKLDSTGGAGDGVYEMWMDDCNADGLGCTGTETLRAQYTDRTLRDGAEVMEVLWMRNDANTGSEGEQFYDQMIVRTQFVGFM